MKLTGSCHCQNIRFELAWPDDAETIPARACDCTFCRKHGGLWTSHPSAALRVQVARPERVSRYAFGTGTARFHICAECGVVPLVSSEIEGQLHAVVSVNALEGLDPARVSTAPISFEGERAEDRLARRRRGWIADVQIA